MNSFAIIYKILKTLEKNMGNENFSFKEISPEKLGISYEQWEQYLIMMNDEGYIKGIVTSKALGDHFRHIAEPIHAEITIHGLEYLAENSLMKKAEETLKLAGEFIP